MIMITIPKDIREYEPKFFGPFTFRQAVSVTAAAVVEFVGVWAQTNIFRLPVASYIPPLFFAMIPLFFGYGDIAFRMKPEVYFRTVFRNIVLIPKYRPYKTHNYYVVHLCPPPPEKADDKDQKKQRKKLKNLPEELQAYQ